MPEANNSLLWEGYFKSEKDLYYNKDKFMNGETNICFITGQSGSGKSSMASSMASKSAKIEHVDLDQVVMNREKLSIDEYAAKMPMAGAFFKGAGSQYYTEPSEKKKKLNYDADNEKITKAFVAFAIAYAKGHKGIKYVIEGTWIFRYIDPSKLKDCAVCIKGTSATTSMARAGKRDKDMVGTVASGYRWIGREGGLQKFRNYFIKLMEDSGDQDEKPVKESVNDISDHIAESVRDFMNENGSLDEACYVLEGVGTLVIPLKKIMEAYIGKNPLGNPELFYESLLRTSVYKPLNEALLQLKENTHYVEAAKDTNNWNYFVRFNSYSTPQSESTINNIPIDDVLKSLCFENSLIDLEWYSSRAFFEASTNNRRDTPKARAEASDFLAYTEFSFEDFDNAHVMYEADQIAQMIKDVHNNIYHLDECIKEQNDGHTYHAVYRKEDVDYLQEHDFFVDEKYYTNLSPQDFYNNLPIYKALYLRMVEAVKNGTSVKDGVYYAGWDKHDWDQSPDQYFDRMSRKVYDTDFAGRKYGQLKIPVCEVDGFYKNKILKKLVKTLSSMIPEEYRMENNSNKPAYYVTITKTTETSQIVLATNYFSWK